MEEKILICDDEPDVRVWLKARLKGFGYRTIEATDGAECLEKVRTDLPSLLVLDINMPELDGFEVCAQLRRNPDTRFLPVVMLTAQRTAVGDRVKGLRLGADDYLPKDVDPEELSARIEAALRRAQNAGEINPLTKLPGNAVITDEIEKRLAGKEPFAVAWADLDNFKAFNDRYGFSRGDEMLKITARALQEALEKYREEGDFVGHVGGDDYVIVCGPDRAFPIAERAAVLVDERLPMLYDLDDRTRGYIRSVDRQGNPQSFPVASVSIAVINSQAARFQNVLQIAEAASEMKKVAKSRSGSQIVVDRRVH